VTAKVIGKRDPDALKYSAKFKLLFRRLSASALAQVTLPESAAV
jgi:hypothetical protein